MVRHSKRINLVMFFPFFGMFMGVYTVDGGNFYIFLGSLLPFIAYIRYNKIK